MSVSNNHKASKICTTKLLALLIYNKTQKQTPGYLDGFLSSKVGSRRQYAQNDF